MSGHSCLLQWRWFRYIHGRVIQRLIQGFSDSFCILGFQDILLLEVTLSLDVSIFMSWCLSIYISLYVMIDIIVDWCTFLSVETHCILLLSIFAGMMLQLMLSELGHILIIQVSTCSRIMLMYVHALHTLCCILQWYCPNFFEYAIKKVDGVSLVYSDA